MNICVFDAALVKEVLAREEADAQAKALEDKARQDKAQKLREQQMVSQPHCLYRRIYTKGMFEVTTPQ